MSVKYEIATLQKASWDWATILNWSLLDTIGQEHKAQIHTHNHLSCREKNLLEAKSTFLNEFLVFLTLNQFNLDTQISEHEVADIFENRSERNLLLGVTLSWRVGWERRKMGRFSSRDFSRRYFPFLSGKLRSVENEIFFVSR